MDMTLSEYLIESVARKKTGKYKCGITRETDPRDTKRLFDESLFREVDDGAMIRWMETNAVTSGNPVYKIKYRSSEIQIYLSVPGGISFVLTYIPMWNGYELANLNRVHGGRADPVDSTTMDKWLDEINGWLR